MYVFHQHCVKRFFDDDEYINLFLNIDIKSFINKFMKLLNEKEMTHENQNVRTIEIDKNSTKSTKCHTGSSPFTLNDSSNIRIKAPTEIQEMNKSNKIKRKVIKCCQKTFTLENFLRKFPIIKWLPKYRCDTFQSDLIAGLTVGLTVIPQGLAYAQVADLPPQFGLYSAFVGCFVYCIMGTSKDITLGPTAILSLMTATFATSVSPLLPTGHKDPTMALLMTLMCGIVQVILGVLNLGILVNFISYPVINAFTTAAAITIGFGQIKTLLGLKNIPDNFIDMVYLTFKKLPETHIWDMTMGLCSFVIVTLLKQLRNVKLSETNKIDHNVNVFKKVLHKSFWIIATASNAIVVITSSGIVAILESRGFNHTVTVTGHIEPGLPEPTLPNFDIDNGNITLSTEEIFSKLGAGLAIVPLLSLVEAMAVGKAFAKVNNYKIDPSQEFLAIGVANIVSSFFQSYPVTGSFSRTAVNSQSGVRTPMGSIWTGGLVIIALCLLTPWFYYIPKSALAAVIISAVLPMIEYHTVLKLWKANKLDLMPYFITFVCSLLVGIEYGILIGVGVSIIILLYPTSRPTIENTTRSGVVIVTPTQGLNFPAAEFMENQVLEKLLKADGPNHVILNMEHLTDMDYTVVQSLKSLQADCSQHNIKMVLANGKPTVVRRIQAADIKYLETFNTISEALVAMEMKENIAVTVTEDEKEHSLTQF